MRTGIYVLNASTLILPLLDKDPGALDLMVNAVDLQRLDHFGKFYNEYHGEVSLVKSIDDVPDTAFGVITFYDDDAQAGALGWHTEDNGKYFGRVFIRPILENGGDLYSSPTLAASAVLSHEILELEADPAVNMWAAKDTSEAGSTLVAKEIGDPVEADSYTVNVSGKDVQVSNFVTPAWFDPQDTDGRYDYLGRLTAPFTMTPGGYWVEQRSGIVTQVFNDKKPEDKYFHIKMNGMLSRTYKRLGISSLPLAFEG